MDLAFCPGAPPNFPRCVNGPLIITESRSLRESEGARTRSVACTSNHGALSFHETVPATVADDLGESAHDVASDRRVEVG